MDGEKPQKQEAAPSNEGEDEGYAHARAGKLLYKHATLHLLVLQLALSLMLSEVKLAHSAPAS